MPFVDPAIRRLTAVQGRQSPAGAVRGGYGEPTSLPLSPF
jgi:hypothetical protein